MRNFFKQNIIIITVFFFTLQLNAQQKQEVSGDKSLSLQEAVDFALKNSADIKNAQIDIEIAKKKIWETTSIGLPQLSGKISYQNIFNVPALSFGKALYLPENIPDATPIDMALMRKLYVDVPPMALGVKENTTFDLTLSQILFSGEYLVGIQASKTYKMISEQGVKKVENDIRENVSNSYQLILMLDKNKKTLDTTLLNVSKVVKELVEVNKAGFMEESDVDQIRLTESNMKSAIGTIERQIEVAKNLLKMQIGLPTEQQIVLTDKLNELLLNSEATNASTDQFNASNNISFQMLETQEKLTQLNLRRYQAQCLPTIVAFYRHEELDKTPTFNFAPKDVLGISVDIPIFASGQRHVKQQQVKLELEKIKNTKENVTKALTIEYAQALAALNNAKEKYTNEKQNVELAKRIATNTLKKYRNGTSTSMELAQTQTQSLQTQISLSQAMYEVLIAKNKLEKVLSANKK